VKMFDRVGLGYRGLRWGDQARASTRRMSSDMFAIDFFWPTVGRLRPFVSGGMGHSSARITATHGGHSYSEYGPASSLETKLWAAGTDIRLFQRVSVIAMFSSMTASGQDSPVQHCQGSLGMSGYVYTCGTSQALPYKLRGLSIGLGIR
jgi:hypothetical protein